MRIRVSKAFKFILCDFHAKDGSPCSSLERVGRGNAIISGPRGFQEFDLALCVQILVEGGVSASILARIEPITLDIDACETHRVAHTTLTSLLQSGRLNLRLY